MSTGNKIKADFLGMPYGTAANRLRKMLLFKFAQELGHDKCFSCNNRIESVEEISIEHKEPWLNREGGVDLFWDLDNIAFSHRSCNKPHIVIRPSLRKVGPKGTGWCSGHQDFLPLDNFWKDKSRVSGYHSYCKECYYERKEVKKNPT